jgi:hypothetical protein
MIIGKLGVDFFVLIYEADEMTKEEYETCELPHLPCWSQHRIEDVEAPQLDVLPALAIPPIRKGYPHPSSPTA